MKRGRVLCVLVGGVFCVAVMSLYRMLELLQKEKPMDQDLYRLQQKIDKLERLLSNNNQLVAKLRDSLLDRKASWENSAGESANHSAADAFSLSAGCREKKEGEEEEIKDGVQLLDVYELLSFDNPDGGVWKQGFEISYRGNEWAEQPLQVYLVPHSHNDPGWLKTFDGYYQDQTRHILNNMLIKLNEDKRRKMIWAEISYFSKWWNEIDDQKRHMVKRLLEAGQLEMVTAGWVMADEANSHYFALLDQLIEGHQWVQKHLGVKPVSGWAIDPFGHSPSMAYLLKGAGLTDMLIQRVHYAVKKHFAKQLTLEFKWRQSWDSAPSSDITCHMMPFYSYDVPHTCGPNPSVCCQFDFARLPGRRITCPWKVAPQPITEQNVKERSMLLLDQYRQKSLLFKSNVLMVALGDDFRFADSTEFDVQFGNYQKIFDYFNQHPELNVKAQFATLSDYFSALHSALGQTGSSLPVVRGDFFTYADRDDHYWSGYFTSRPFYKRMDRVLEATLRATEILFSLTLAEVRRHGNGLLATETGTGSDNNNNNNYPWRENFGLMTSSRRNLGLFQHHDGITGTAKDAVVVDYGTRMFHSILNLRQVIVSSAHFLLLSDKTQYSHDQSQPFLQMVDVMAAQDALPQKTPHTLSEDPRSIIVYNPSEQKVSSVVSVVVDSPLVRIVDAHSDRPITAQVSAVWAGPSTPSTDSFQLDFVADLPPLSLVVYHVTKSSSGSAPLSKYTFRRRGNTPEVRSDHFLVTNEADAHSALSLSNKHVQIWSDGNTGLMQKLQLLSTGLTRELRVQFLWYGTTSKADRSGAYLFMPGGEATPYSDSDAPLVRVSEGPAFSDITSCFRHMTHRVRLFHHQGTSSIQLSNTVDVRSEVNRELVMRIQTDVANGNRFFTDLNSFQMQQRRTLDKLPLQANFYPMTSSAFLQDKTSRITLLSAQSQAVAGLKSGQLEVVLDRRLHQDDNRGLGQGVTDNKLTASLFNILLEERKEVGGASVVEHLSLLAHLSSLSLCHPPITMVAPGNNNNKNNNKQQPKLRPFLPVTSSLPCDLHLVNMRTLEDEKESGVPGKEVALILHRKGFDCRAAILDKLQCTVNGKEEVNLAALFSPVSFSSVIGSNLTLLREDDEKNPKSARQQQQSTDHMTRIPPMEIRAFRVTLH